MSVVLEIVSSALELVWTETVVTTYRRFGLAAAVLVAIAPLALLAGGIAILFWA
jgi:hypothetical protein